MRSMHNLAILAALIAIPMATQEAVLKFLEPNLELSHSRLLTTSVKNRTIIIVELTKGGPNENSTPHKH
jgi:hypothetical protein